MKAGLISIILLLPLALQLGLQVQAENEEVREVPGRYKIFNDLYRSKRIAHPQPDPTIYNTKKEVINIEPLNKMPLAPRAKTKVASGLQGTMGRAFMRSYGRGMSEEPVVAPPADNSTETSNANGTRPVHPGLKLMIDAIPNEPYDTEAQYGEPCNPTNAITPDYCERAKYPNKARMICTANACGCKFGKKKGKDGKAEWVQLKYDPAKKMCVSPLGGICYVMFPVLEQDGNSKTDEDGNPVYTINITEAHEQCDNSGPDTLKCSKAHPRRFSKFNQYNYYCLSDIDQAPKLE